MFAFEQQRTLCAKALGTSAHGFEAMQQVDKRVYSLQGK
jgi:hypothetical protein